jgi:transketolase
MTPDSWSREDIDLLARQLSADSIVATTAAGSGHPTSALSASHLVATLFTRHLRTRIDRSSIHADRFVLSKGHAAPLLYAALVAVGALEPAALLDLREKGSPLEGHPRPGLPLVDVATGSLGQGLAIGMGIALGLERQRSQGRVWVLMGDSETAEGSVWEAMDLAREHSVSNLRAIIDMNRLGQTGPTMLGWNGDAFASRATAFGWKAAVVDGHDPDGISRGLEELDLAEGPGVLVARTVKGHGVSFLADRADRHGTALTLTQAEHAIAELQPPRRLVIDLQEVPEGAEPEWVVDRSEPLTFEDEISTRDAFGRSLAYEVGSDSRLMVIDAEVSNSTKTDEVARHHPDQFLQMYIAEQTMVGVAIGMQAVGIHPVVSTFAAFLTRAHDFLRMAAIGHARLLVNGSHAGVSIGEDGPSQMGLDDLAMMRGLPGCTVLYPADGNSTSALVRLAAQTDGISYIRTTRESTSGLYPPSATFEIGGSHTLRGYDKASCVIVGSGITVHQALAAAEELGNRGVNVGVIDAYSVQPVDRQKLRDALEETGWLLVVEDHGPVGGLGDAVLEAVAEDTGGRVTKLSVTGIPGSAGPKRQRALHGISAEAIVATVEDALLGWESRRP